MHESELGPIPVGWRVLPLDEIAEFLNGLALQKYSAENDQDYLPVIKIRELRNGITNSTDRANKNIPSNYIIKDGDLLFSWSGSLEVKFWVGGEGALNQHLFKVSSTDYPSWKE
jgi:type I restriction enzyme S subunit